LPRRSGFQPLRRFRWIPKEHFKAGIESIQTLAEKPPSLTVAVIFD